MISLKKLLTKILQWIKAPTVNYTTHADEARWFTVTNPNATVRLGTGANNSASHGVWSATLGRWLVHGDASNVYVGGVNVATLTTSYIVSTGSSGYWTWRKWSDGRFEAWIDRSTSITLNTALANSNGWYRNASAYTYSIPTDIGATAVTHADIHTISGLAGMVTVVTAISGTTISYYVISPAASASAISGRAVTMTAYITGTWS